MLSYVIPTAEDKPNPFRPPDEDSPHVSHEGGEEPQSSIPQPSGSQPPQQTDLVDPISIDSHENGDVETNRETLASSQASQSDSETPANRTTSVSVELSQNSRSVVAERILEEDEEDGQGADGSLSECRSLQSDSLATPGSEDRSVSKLTKPALKRVSFGSSKGSMVETLIYDTSVADDRTADSSVLRCPAPAPPQPIKDPVALKFGSEVAAPQKPASKVRVSFFESDHPQVVASPEPSELDSPCSSLLRDYIPSSSAMASSPGLHVALDRQLSSESGRDNPFRPDGDISKEADEIVQRIKSGQPLLNGGQPASPSADCSSPPPAGSPEASSPCRSPVAEPEVSKTDSGNTQQQGAPPSSQNGTTTAASASPLPPKATPAAPSTVEVTHSTLPASQPAAAPQHVVLKKKNKCGCCVLQ